MVCEKIEGQMATIGFSSVNACFQELQAEVEENGEGIQEIIDVLASVGGSSIGGSGGESGQIQSPNFPDFYPPSSYEVISEI